MQKAQYGILRFAKYKGPEISNIEAHNERKKEKYASNPDIDTSRKNLNYHLIEPIGKYRADSNRLIEEYGCRTRKDNPFGCGAYGQENSAYAPFLCPNNAGWKTLCKRDSWK